MAEPKSSNPVPMISTREGPACGKCGYLLGGLASQSLCPECGTHSAPPVTKPKTAPAFYFAPVSMGFTILLTKVGSWISKPRPLNTHAIFR